MRSGSGGELRQRAGSSTAVPAVAVAKALPLLAWYGTTGNLALFDVDRDEARRTLKDITATEWAVVVEKHLEQGLTALSDSLDR